MSRLWEHGVKSQSFFPLVRVKGILQFLERGILIGSARDRDMFSQFIEADRLSLGLSMKPSEVGHELYFFCIQMEWNTLDVPTRHMEHQAQLFELY